VRNAAVVDAALHLLGHGRLRVDVTLMNHGEADNRTLTLRSDGETLAEAPVELAGHDRTARALETSLPEDGREDDLYLPLEIALDHADSLEADDVYRLGVVVPRRIERRILVVTGHPDEGFLVAAALRTLSSRGSAERYEVRVVSHLGTPAGVLWKAPDVVVFTSPPVDFAPWAEVLAEKVASGTKLVLFLPGEVEPLARFAADDDALLPAAPAPFEASEVRLAPRPISAVGDPLSPDGVAAQALLSYRLHELPMAGRHGLEPRGDGTVLWEYEDGTPFILHRRVENGEAVLVNTSADDSLGTLMKSPAAVAFCRYLFARQTREGSLAGAAGEPMRLPAAEVEREAASDGEAATGAWLKTPSGEPWPAGVAHGVLSARAPLEMGWVETVFEPKRYFGVNPPAGETALDAVPDGMPEALLARAFTTRDAQAVRTASTGELLERGRKPLWKYVAIALIALVLAEAFVTNRLKR
jgi:hypothetical protein